MNSNLDVIRISGLEVVCIVGIYPDERNTPQPLSVDVALYFNTKKAGLSEDLSLTIDYAAVSAQVVFLLEACEFQLLETAAEALATFLLTTPAQSESRAQVEKVEVKLTKPSALAGRATPSLAITRHRSELAPQEVEDKTWGTVDVLFETDDVGIYRLNVAPQNGIPLHVHRIMDECEFVMTEGIQCQLKVTPVGAVFCWPKGAPHRYDNPTNTWQSVLCVDRPKFIPSDEIPVDPAVTELADIQAETAWTMGTSRRRRSTDEDATRR